MSTTGTLCKFKGEIKFEWEIKDFLQLEGELDKKFTSPEFSFYGVLWELWIYPYGEKCQESVGYLGLYVVSKKLPKPVTMNVSLNLKSVEEKNDLERTFKNLFDKEMSGWGKSKFISRSDLIKRKSELLTSDALTIICTIKNTEPNAVSEFLDASVQTEEGTGIWKLQQHLHEISLNGDTSDITLKVEDQEFKLHRCILAARSPVFSAMMKSKMKETVTGVVDIQDIDQETFSHFLNYIYTGSTKDITTENVTKLYTAADKYQVEVLKENCLDYMLENVSIENFCDTFILSLQHNEEKLKKTCIQYFAKHSLDIIETSKWQSFLSENPIVGNELFIKLLKSNKINTVDNTLEE